MIVYMLDNKDIWTGAQRDIDPYGPVPAKISLIEPPALSEGQYAKWFMGSWKVLDSYPINPTPDFLPELDILTTDTWTIPADAATFATVTYTDDSTVYFSVNEVSHAVEPVEQVATLEITADAPGPIRVEVKAQQLIITALEVI